ncbi:MAG: helix-turn-helix transcriptional regulator [candidate division Zixibacteria bacterium]|nr:helix-turn-helix transcriptional regulator [candidate division Zixibacteria bacterium]
MRHKLFGSRLRELREKKGLVIKDLAPELNVTYTHLSNIELGYKKPSEDFIRRVAAFFGVDEEELTILAGYIPNDISEILSKYPKDAPKYLRDMFKPKKETE